MPISATFLADFSKFNDAVQQADVKIKSFEADANKVEKALGRMGESFSGRKVVQEAALMVKVLGDAEGISRLTAKELKAAGDKAAEFADKLKRIGGETGAVQAGLQRIVTEAKKLDQKPIDDGAAAWKRFTDSIKGADITNPLQAAQGAVAALGQDLSLLAGGAGLVVAALGAVTAALFRLTGDAAKVGAELDDMADKTGVSVQALSRLKNAAEVGGTDMGRMTDALFKLQKGLEEDSDAVSKGLERIGLTTAQVKAAGPDKMLGLVADGFAKTEDAGKRAAAATAIFKDRTGEMIPALLDLNAGMEATADIMPWTPEQAAAAERFEQHVRSINVHIKAQAEALGRDLIPAVDRTTSVLLTGVEQFHKTAYEMSSLKAQIDVGTIAWQLYAEAVEKANGTPIKPPPAPAAPSTPGVQLPGIAGVMATDLAKGLELVASAEAKLNAEVAVSIDRNTRAAAAAKQTAAEYKQWAAILEKDAAAGVVTLTQRLAELEARAIALRAVVPLDVQAGIDESDSQHIWELAKSFTGLGEEITITSAAITDYISLMDRLKPPPAFDPAIVQARRFQELVGSLDQALGALAGTSDNTFSRIVRGIQRSIPLWIELLAKIVAANAALAVTQALKGFAIGIGIAAAFLSRGGRITESGGVQYFPGGGRVAPFPGGPRGSDTVPAWLTPGEVVLTKDQQRKIAGSKGGMTIAPVFNFHGPVVGNAGREIAKIATDAIVERIAQNKGGAYTRLRGAIGVSS